MESILFEIIIIFLLLLANGLFAMTEIAVVSARKTRLRMMADGGDPRARVALDLAESPNRFLSTVQIGITMVGIFAGAYGGATIAEKIATALQAIPTLAPYGNAIGLAFVVVVISYLTLVLGELVPKRLGLSNPENIALSVAKPMRLLSRWAYPLVTFLSFSTDALLKVFQFKPSQETAVTDEEVKGLMREGLRAGAFHQVESQMVESVLELDQLLVRDIMTPRPKIIWLNKEDSHETVWHKIVVSGHTFFPVFEGDRDHVVGVVSVKAIYANVAAGAGSRIADLMVTPLIVPATQTVLQLVETFKRTGKHLAMVTDEFGNIIGLVTLNDVMEAIVGELISLEERSQPAVQHRPDGSWLVDAMIEAEKLERALPGLKLGHAVNRDFQTLAGFVVKQLGHVPKEGETFEWQGYVFEVLDMDRHRVDKVLLMPLKTEPRSVS